MIERARGGGNGVRDMAGRRQMRFAVWPARRAKDEAINADGFGKDGARKKDWGFSLPHEFNLRRCGQWCKHSSQAMKF